MRLLILGAGYVGGRLRARYADGVATRRSGGNGLLHFDLADETTYANLPSAEAIVWTFPPQPAAAVARFLEVRGGSARKMIVLGSTSAYLADEPDAWVDEATPLDLSQPRVEGEEQLRRAGATVLQLAGIWGPGRDPLDWLLQGRIRNGAKYLNLAHVEDILSAIETLLVRPQPGERINVCDGEPTRWSEIAKSLIRAGKLPEGFALREEAPGRDSKRVRNLRLRGLLPDAYQFRRFA
jgi:nucleoside-diphosphate-sugar epimerase